MPLWRPRRRWDDRTKVGLQEVGWGGIKWIDVAEDELPGSVKCMELPVWLASC